MWLAKTGRPILLLALVAISAACSAGIPKPDVGAEVPAGVDLSGTWQLDRNLSQDPRQKMREAMDAAPNGTTRGAGRRAGGMRGSGGMGRPSGTGGERPNRGDRPGIVQPQKLLLEQGAAGIHLDDGSVSWKLTYGQDAEHPDSRETITVLSGWQREQLVVYREGPDGAQRSDRYSRSDVQLRVETSIKPKRAKEPITIVSVYNRVSDRAEIGQ